MARELTEMDRERGRRLKAIRDALDLSQAAMVDVLNAAAETLGLPGRYQYYTVSRMESGSISFEDAAVWLYVDPARGDGALRWDWFARGTTELPRRGRAPKALPALKPVPRPEQGGSAKRRSSGG